MNIVAVDVSRVDYANSSMDYHLFLKSYRGLIDKVLSQLTFPLRVITWNNYIPKYKVCSDYTKDLLNLDKRKCFIVENLFHFLPDNKSIELYLFTNTRIDADDIERCRIFLKKKPIQISHVHIYYMGSKNLGERAMNLSFTSIFQGIPQHIYIDVDPVAFISTGLPNFEAITHDDIMKDHSFIGTIIAHWHDIDKFQLKREIVKLACRIFKEYYQDKISIHPFYVENDREGCISYLRNNPYIADRVNFLRKISHVLQLLDPCTYTYCLTHLKMPTEVDCDEFIWPEEEKLECQYLTYNIFNKGSKIVGIPIRRCKETIWPNKTWNVKNMFKTPFKILEFEEICQNIVDKIDHGETFRELNSLDVLQDCYLLHNNGIDIKSLIEHNNYVLSAIFQNGMPNQPVLWHIMFLYILATRKFPEMKDRLFEEIRFLGENTQYFITLTSSVNPPIIESLNCCFWYIACVCHEAYPNSKRNVLRKQFVSGEFLRFYKDVYKIGLKEPKDMHLWQLWNNLYTAQLDIFKILAFFYEHENLNTGKYPILLYRSKKEPEFPKQFHFLSKLDLKTILNIYLQFKKPNSSYFENLSHIKHCNVQLHGGEAPSLLHHVKINPKTCRPYEICKVTGKPWKKCMGVYDPVRESYLKMFERYCKVYKRYPRKSEDLCAFLNNYMFKHKGKIPELFSKDLKDKMQLVMDIFAVIREKYSCLEYLLIRKYGIYGLFMKRF